VFITAEVADDAITDSIADGGNMSANSRSANNGSNYQRPVEHGVVRIRGHGRGSARGEAAQRASGANSDAAP
jgi:hypothetical protein